MSSEDILLDIVNQIKDDVANVRVDVASIKGDIHSIQSSVEVLNHNSTSIDARVSTLETKQITGEAINNYLKSIKSSVRNWVLFTCAVVSAVLAVLAYIHPF